MDSISLDRSRHIYEIFVDHGDEGDVMLRGEVAIHLVECVDVVRPVIRRQSNAGEQDLDVGLCECSEDGIEVFSSLFQGNTTEPVVAAELYDHDRRMRVKHGADIGGGILGGCSAGSHVRNFIGESQPVEIALQGVWKRLARVQAVPSGDAVAVADKDRPFGGRCRDHEDRERKRNENPAPSVHINSVMSQEGNVFRRWAVYPKEAVPGDRSP
jgi:hypothetical protein